MVLWCRGSSFETSRERDWITGGAAGFQVRCHRCSTPEFQRVGRHPSSEEDSSSLPSKVSYRPCGPGVAGDTSRSFRDTGKKWSSGGFAMSRTRVVTQALFALSHGSRVPLSRAA